jgi:hypothetical protein
MTFTFSEVVTGFVSSDITVTNSGTVSAFTTSDNIVFNVEITPPADGDYVVSVADSVCTDIATNGNTASVSTTFTFDTTGPVRKCHTRNVAHEMSHTVAVSEYK